MKNLKTIGVMGSGRKSWAYLSEPLGKEIARRPVNLLTGGGNGVMRTVSRAFTSVSERQGKAIGCIPYTVNKNGEFTSPYGYPNPYVEIAINAPLGVYNSENPDLVTRNFINVLSSDIIVALPGLGGTRNEIDLSVLFNKNFILFGPEEEFSDLPAEMPRATNLDQAVRWIDHHLAYT